ncbi:MAG TPA: SPASM domain-containing protein [Methylococcaceae bacterium]|nr:SPASM domain-containing protein [Methylococcaceae bacterium]
MAFRSAPTPVREPLAIDKLGFDIVHGCQLRCVGCPNSTLKPKIKQIEPEDFGRALANIDVTAVNLFRLFNFGEPLLHERLPEILLQIPKQRWRARIVEISTNAQYHGFEVLAEAFKTEVLTRLNVSCDGDGTPEDYERLRPPGKWDKLMSFMRKARELRDRYAPSMALMTRTICTDSIARQRWREMLEPMGFAVEFRDWQYLPESSSNMLTRPLAVPDGVCTFIKPGNRLYVDWDGTVVPCCVHPRAAVFGNLLEQRYSEILAGTRREEIIRTMLVNRHGMKICNECEY